jgi:hypothetical protein
MTISKKTIQLPTGIPPIGVSESEAAKAWGISPSAFIKLDPKLKPRARRLGERKVYSWIELQDEFMKLPLWDDGDEKDTEDEWSAN